MIRSFFASLFSLATLISLTVLAIAGSAGYFSIYGLVLIFSGAVIPVMIMAGSLEVGKLVLTSVLFNYWRKMNFLLTFYCVVAVICLMVITSVGIYGFLSSAYQTNQAPLAQINKRIELLDQEFERKNARLLQMDKVVEAIPSNMVNSRLREKRQQDPERKMLQARVIEIEKEKLEISNSQLETEVHLGPIVKIAEAFGVTKDRAVHLLIMLFIFVFDPLAVALTLCVNVVISDKINQNKKNQINTSDVTIPDVNHGTNSIVSNTALSSIKIDDGFDDSLNVVTVKQETPNHINNIGDVQTSNLFDSEIKIDKHTPVTITNLVNVENTLESNDEDVVISNSELPQSPLINNIADIASDEKLSLPTIEITQNTTSEPEVVKNETNIESLLSQLGEKIDNVKKQTKVTSVEDVRAQVINNIHQGK